MSFPKKILNTTGALKNYFAFSIDLTSQLFDYFGHVPSEGFANVAKEARTVTGFISGIEFFRDINQLFFPKSILYTFETAASLTKKFFKFLNYLHTKKIVQFWTIKDTSICESYAGTIASTISCCTHIHERYTQNTNSKLNSAAIITSGAFALYDGLSSLDRMGWTREFKTAKLCFATAGIAAGIFQVGYKHFSYVKKLNP